MQALNDLLYLISLRIRNYMFQPHDPLICLTDASVVEQSAIITQWCKDKLNLKIIAAKSTLFTTAQPNPLSTEKV